MPLRLLLGSILLWSALPGAPIDLPSAVAQFISRNHDLRIARQQNQKTKADLITAAQRPNPVLSGGYDYLDVLHGFRDTSAAAAAFAMLHIDQTLETGGKRDRRIDLASAAATSADLGYDETVRGQLASLVTVYYTVAAEQEEYRHALHNKDAYEQIVAVAKAKRESGFLSEIDYQKIVLQKIDYLNDVENSRLALRRDSLTLATLLALPLSDLTVTEPLPSSTGDLPSLQLLMARVDERPDCKTARQNIAVARAAVGLAKADAVPDLTVGAEYEAYAAAYKPLFGVSFSLPLPVFAKNEGEIEKSRIALLQAEELYTKTVEAAQADILQNYSAAESQKNLYEATKAGLAFAENLKEKEEKIFALKAVSILEFLDAQKSFRDYQKNLARAAAAYQSALALLRLSAALPLSDGIQKN